MALRPRGDISKVEERILKGRVTAAEEAPSSEPINKDEGYPTRLLIFEGDNRNTVLCFILPHLS